HHLDRSGHLGFCECQALLHYHPLRLALRQGATRGEPCQPHCDDDVGIPCGLRKLKISGPRIEHGLSPVRRSNYQKSRIQSTRFLAVTGTISTSSELSWLCAASRCVHQSEANTEAGGIRPGSPLLTPEVCQRPK